MSKEKEKEKKDEKSEKEIDWSKIEPCTIEDIIVSNIITKKSVLKIKPKNGAEKEVFVEYRRLNVGESAELSQFDFTKNGNDSYERKILYMASLVPKFPKPTDNEAWTKIDHAFRTNYLKKVNEYANQNDFLY